MIFGITFRFKFNIAQIYVWNNSKTSQRADTISPGFSWSGITLLVFANLQFTFGQIYDLLISRNFTILIHTNLIWVFLFHTIDFFRANLKFQFRTIYFTFGLFTLFLFRAILRFLRANLEFNGFTQFYDLISREF